MLFFVCVSEAFLFRGPIPNHEVGYNDLASQFVPGRAIAWILVIVRSERGHAKIDNSDVYSTSHEPHPEIRLPRVKENAIFDMEECSGDIVMNTLPRLPGTGLALNMMKNW